MSHLNLINHFPHLPFLVPMPERRPGVEHIAHSAAERSSEVPTEAIPTRADVQARAKWSGFWKTVRDVARVQMPAEARAVAEAGEEALGQGQWSRPRWEKNEMFYKPGVVGGTATYTSPVPELGHVPGYIGISPTSASRVAVQTLNNFL